MKVSVIIPVYNAENFIESTVEMLCKQTFTDIEIILVNDGSTDRSGEICNELSEHYCNVRAIHLENSGVCVARNKGVEVAQGEYITFCDADDIIDERLIEVLYNLAIECNCDMSIVKYATVFSDGKVKNGDSTERIKKYANNTEAIKAFFEGEIFSGVYTKLLSRELASKLLFEEGRKINEDRMYVFNALKTARAVCFKDECLYRYIRRDVSSSNGHFKKEHFDCVYFAKKMEKIVERDFPEILSYAKANSLHTYFDMLKMMCIYNAQEEYSESFEEYVKILRAQKLSFVKKHLTKNDFIKWIAIKINKKLFRLIINKFGRT